ncbi:MAG: hypothetical protein GX556_03195 [Fibrobacter sp.]|nr:hypothetical protein [Fibrobacter sp.]
MNIYLKSCNNIVDGIQSKEGNQNVYQPVRLLARRQYKAVWHCEMVSVAVGDECKESPLRRIEVEVPLFP